MALAAYGEPIYVSRIRRHLLDPKDPDRIGTSLLERPCHHASWAAAIEEFFGPARGRDREITREHKDVAASIQQVFEQDVLRRVGDLSRRISERVCCLAGGAFLNSVAVGRIRRDSIYDDLWVPPVTSDAGLSLGAALLRAAEIGLARWQWDSAHLGDSLAVGSLESEARNLGVRVERLEDPIAWSADALSRGAILGWCHGRLEVGPRALGNRSILADPRSPAARDRVNAIKKREDWRPFAPVILEEDAVLWLDDPSPAPYMTEVRQWRSRAVLPAVVHVNGTARVQTVNRVQNERLWLLLKRFKAATGIGVLLNTSLNVQGMPIARTVRDCIDFFHVSCIDELVIGDLRVSGRTGKTVGKKIDFAAVAALPEKYVVASYGPPAAGTDAVLESAVEYTMRPLEEVLRLQPSRPLLELARRTLPLVVLTPVHIEVLSVAAPRLFVQLMHLGQHFDEVRLVDPHGHDQHLDHFRKLRSPDTLATEFVGDFETHVLNRRRWP